MFVLNRPNVVDTFFDLASRRGTYILSQIQRHRQHAEERYRVRVVDGVVVVAEMQVLVIRLFALEIEFLRLDSPCDLSEFLRKKPFLQQTRRASVAVCKRMDTYADKVHHTRIIKHLVVRQISFHKHINIVHEFCHLLCHHTRLSTMMIL